MAMVMPLVQKCTVTECSYNTETVCHAMAITVGQGTRPLCDTFYKTDHKGGAVESKGRVGACKEEHCRFNESLECTASKGITVSLHEQHADCVTFAVK